MYIYMHASMMHTYMMIASSPGPPYAGEGPGIHTNCACARFFPFFFLFFQEGNRILSRKKLALKKRSFVNLYNTRVNIHSR